MSDLAAALLASLGDDDLDRLAARLAPKLERHLKQTGPGDDGWLDTKRAAAYAGMSVNALHKLTSARLIPFEQQAPGCKCWFKRSELDTWRVGG